MKAPRFLVAALVFSGAGLFAADSLTIPQQEEFLKTAKVVKTQASKKGVTDTIRATLSDGKTTHDASIQTIDESRALFQGTSGTTEIHFRDSYLYNIAAWRLAKLLGLHDSVPPSIDRKYMGKSGAYTWWIDDVAMDEEERVKKKLTAPDPDAWAREVAVMHVFDQLIYNTDSNATNMLIDKQWHIWMIDHTRAFRTQKTLQDPKMLSRVDRNILAKMKSLDEPTLTKEMKGYLDKSEIQGVLARRDLMVKFFETKGDSALFDRPSRP